MYTLYTLLTIAPFLLRPALAEEGKFHLRDTFIGHDFLHGFTWETMNDPTNGRVNYVDRATAQKNNLTYASDHKFVMRPDYKKIVPASARGRDSVRITSRNAYTDSVLVLDLQHMPHGCGTWPAFWTLTKQGPWPTGGEIDIIEGVNINGQNTASLHTRPGCTMPRERPQAANVETTDCDASVNGNTGCGNEFTGPGTYGHTLNLAGGGYYVMKRTAKDGAFVWFWGRNDAHVPDDVKNGRNMISPDESWGKPQVRFPTDHCDFNKYFDAHQIVFDLTFCGDWAGGTYSASGCGAGSCIDFVNNNPESFKDAYWDINSLRAYTP